MAVYNESFRARVVEFLRKGHTYQETAEVFGVSMSAHSRVKRNRGCIFQIKDNLNRSEVI